MSAERVVPRAVPEGVVPLVSFEGDAYDCGRAYAEYTLEHHPGYRSYLDMAWEWTALAPEARALFETRAPHILDLYCGLTEVAGPPEGTQSGGGGGCTAFSIPSGLTLDGHPISGQTKDTGLASAERYIVLRIRPTGAPTILVLAYPGEVLGYGMWSTGMSIFRNALHRVGQGQGKLSMVEWGLLALASDSVADAAELAGAWGIAHIGNCLVSDATGASASVEFSAGGTHALIGHEGAYVHTNHGLAGGTRAAEEGEVTAVTEDSHYRRARLLKLLEAEAGKLTAQKALMALADHSHYPRGICRHIADGSDYATTAAVIAEPTRGRLHVVRGNPCCNWPVTYSV